MDECYRALTYQLDWTNPEGHKHLVDMGKPLPLQDKKGRLIIPEIVVRRADQNLYKFKEGDFPDLHLNDIEDMLLLIAQNKLFNLEGDVIMDFVTALKIQNRKDLPRDIPLARIKVLRYDTKGVKVRMGIMKTKTELTLEQTQQGVSDEVLNIRVMLYSIHNDDGNPTSANIKQALRQIVTNRFTLIVLSALRRFDKENKQVRSVLTEPEDHVKMEMETPRSSRVKFITACSYSVIKSKDMIKAQVHVTRVFRYSDTQNIFLEVIKCSR
ncbi:hypothetical protein Tco_0636872 [Tanacetum coccineum]